MSSSHSPVDVYAFGILAFEVSTQTRAYAEMNAEQIMKLVSEGTRPTIPRELELQSPFAATLMQLCWAHKEKERPTIFQVAILLDDRRKGRSRSSLDSFLKEVEVFYCAHA